MFKPKLVHIGNLRRVHFGFKKTRNIHFILLHEVHNLMLFQRIIKSPDVPAVNYHQIVGEVGGLLPLPPDFLLPLLVATT